MARPSLARQGRRPGRRVPPSAVLLAVAVGLVCFYLGADLWRSLLLGVAITVVVAAGSLGLALGLEPETEHTRWRGERVGRLRGTRTDVASLSSGLAERWGRANLANGRIAQIARQRVALHDLDLHRPGDRAAIEQLVGRRTYRLLVAGGRRGLRLRSFVHVLDTLDALDPRRVAPGTAPVAAGRVAPSGPGRTGRRPGGVGAMPAPRPATPASRSTRER